MLSVAFLCQIQNRKQVDTIWQKHVLWIDICRGALIWRLWEKKRLLCFCINFESLDAASQRKAPFCMKFHIFVFFSSFFGLTCQRDFGKPWKNVDTQYSTLGGLWNDKFFHLFQKSILRLFWHIDHGSIGYPLWIPKFGVPKFSPNLELRDENKWSKWDLKFGRLILDHF